MFRPSTRLGTEVRVLSRTVPCVPLRFVQHHPFSLRICVGALWTVNNKHKRAESRDLLVHGDTR